MIQEAIDRFLERKEQIKSFFKEKHPDNYLDIVKNVVANICDKDNEEILNMDPNRIHVIDDGDYQGTLLFVIPEDDYQPNQYYYVKVSYGSCSACDTLQRIKDAAFDDEDWDENIPNEKQIEDYMTLSLHITEWLKKMED